MDSAKGFPTLRAMLNRFRNSLLWVLVSLNVLYLADWAARTQSWFSWSAEQREQARFRAALEVVAKNYIDPAVAAPEKLGTAALAGMIESLDPHSEFLERSDYDDFREDLSSEFGGIGVQIELREEKVTVIAPIPGTPGDRAGIHRGDQIVSVNGESLKPPLLTDAVRRLKGTPGTEVALTLLRPSTGAKIDLRIEREVIQVRTVRLAKMETPQIGYIYLAQFSERTGEEFTNALSSLEEKGLRALIIDLRNNPGGLLTAAVEVLEPFFKTGELVVYTEGRDGRERRELRAKTGSDKRSYPIAVLVNASSASASEIVAGALRDTQRAVIVGEKTFGKGSVQSLIPLAHGEAIRLTTAFYYTPSGRKIHAQGIEPDINVTLSDEDDSKISLQSMRDDFATPTEFKERFGFEPIADLQKQAALDALEDVLHLREKNPAAAPVPSVLINDTQGRRKN